MALPKRQWPPGKSASNLLSSRRRHNFFEGARRMEGFRAKFSTPPPQKIMLKKKHQKTTENHQKTSKKHQKTIKRPPKTTKNHQKNLVFDTLKRGFWGIKPPRRLLQRQKSPLKLTFPGGDWRNSDTSLWHFLFFGGFLMGFG